MSNSPPAGSAGPQPQATSGDAISPYGNYKVDFKNLSSSFAVDVQRAQAEKKTYLEKLESATGINVFKLLLLIDSSAIEKYVAQTRLQAEQSFNLSKKVAIAGFVLIATGIILGISANILGINAMGVEYLAGLAGILSEFISGVFFFLFNRTINQLNRFHDKMLSSKQITMSFLASSLIEDKVKREDTLAELSKKIIG